MRTKPESGERGSARPETFANDLSVPWHAAWTRSNFEKRVADQLASRGLGPFLPMMDLWRNGTAVSRRVPMYPGYVFIKGPLDKEQCNQAIQCQGLVRLLGRRWDQLAVVPPHEIEAVRRVAENDVPVEPYNYLSQGERVRVIRGPLAGVEGILVGSAGDTKLALTVELFRRTVVARVEANNLMPVLGYSSEADRSRLSRTVG